MADNQVGFAQNHRTLKDRGVVKKSNTNVHSIMTNKLGMQYSHHRTIEGSDSVKSLEKM